MDPLRPSYDLAVIGAGINGAGIARDAAGRGLSVLLVERDDLAQHTSSASTKLIHGGLRYLEYYEFRLVRKALMEREVLLRAAPHITWPMRFVMPHDRGMRPVWMVRAGLFLYDHLARREFLPGSAVIDLRRHAAGLALKPGYSRGFEYSDGWVDDARMVVVNTIDASRRGATVRTHTALTRAKRHAQDWEIEITSRARGPEVTRARMVVNAAGPWVAGLLKDTLNVTSPHRIRLVKGSHIVVPRLFDHEYAYILQNPDRRIIFAIPYEERFTLIGTTDVDFHADPGTASIDPAEVEYLCAMARRYFEREVRPEQVVHRYSGVRPLLEDEASDASAVTRDYWLELDRSAAPVLSVFGGKITTFRRLAEEAMEKILPSLDVPTRAHRAWTAEAVLPGGEMRGKTHEAFAASLQATVPGLPTETARRYARTYGALCEGFLGRVRSVEDLGREIAPGVFEQELVYLRDHEWATSGEDVLWRRTKLGLHLNVGERAAVCDWMRAHPAELGPPRSDLSAATG